MALREHGDEMKAQVTESFAADKLKEAEAKASLSVEFLGREDLTPRFLVFEKHQWSC